MSDQERAEMEKELEELERSEFFLQMKDHWSSNDYQRDREMSSRINELKRILQKEQKNV